MAKVRHVCSEFHHASTKIPIFIKHSAGVAVYTDGINIDMFQVRDFLSRKIALLMPMKVVVLIDTNPVAVIRIRGRKCR